VVAAAQAGDLAAFDILARKYRRASVVLARQIVSAEAAEDAVQEALLSAYKALPLLDDATRFAPWLAAIVRNRARRVARGSRLQPVPLDSVIVAYAPGIVQRMIEDHREESLRCALSKLAPDVRELVELHHLEHWSAPQIAQFLDLPLSTVKWRLHAARKELRSRLLVLEEEE
jgi:RNA polymerase sigma-70 factor (ECF subfamily)